MNHRKYTLKRLGKKSFFSNLSVTNWLILLNVIFYFSALIVLLFIPNFLDYIALKPSNILQGKYLWTIFTHMFMHAPGFVFHLLFNMISLFFLGNLVERIIGRKRYFIFYLISGVAAGLFFIFLSFLFENSFILGTGLDWNAVGASGALFGVAGLMTLLTPNLPLYVMFIPYPINAKYAVPGLLVVMALIAASASWPVGNAAHFGGFLAGIFYGFYLTRKYPKKTEVIRKLFR